MVNGYNPFDEYILVYPCRCGDTLCTEPALIMPCCLEKGWEQEDDD